VTQNPFNFLSPVLQVYCEAFLDPRDYKFPDPPSSVLALHQQCRSVLSLPNDLEKAAFLRCQAVIEDLLVSVADLRHPFQNAIVREFPADLVGTRPREKRIPRSDSFGQHVPDSVGILRVPCLPDSVRRGPHVRTRTQEECQDQQLLGLLFQRSSLNSLFGWHFCSLMYIAGLNSYGRKHRRKKSIYGQK